MIEPLSSKPLDEAISQFIKTHIMMTRLFINITQYYAVYVRNVRSSIMKAQVKEYQLIALQIYKGVNFMRQIFQKPLQGLTYSYLFLCACSSYKSNTNMSISSAYATFFRTPSYQTEF